MLERSIEGLITVLKSTANIFVESHNKEKNFERRCMLFVFPIFFQDWVQYFPLFIDFSWVLIVHSQCSALQFLSFAFYQLFLLIMFKFGDDGSGSVVCVFSEAVKSVESDVLDCVGWKCQLKVY